jgi:hypothetical protein
MRNELDTDVKVQNSACADALFLLTTHTRWQAPYGQRKDSDWNRGSRRGYLHMLCKMIGEKLSAKGVVAKSVCLVRISSF